MTNNSLRLSPKRLRMSDALDEIEKKFDVNIVRDPNNMQDELDLGLRKSLPFLMCLSIGMTVAFAISFCILAVFPALQKGFEPDDSDVLETFELYIIFYIMIISSIISFLLIVCNIVINKESKR